MTYDDNLAYLFATTEHGEVGQITGPAHDPARCKFMPYPINPETEAFTPRLASLTFQRVGIVAANRIATQEERARAWIALMSATVSGTDDALVHACGVLQDAVTYRLNKRD